MLSSRKEIRMKVMYMGLQGNGAYHRGQEVAGKLWKSKDTPCIDKEQQSLLHMWRPSDPHVLLGLTP